MSLKTEFSLPLSSLSEIVESKLKEYFKALKGQKPPHNFYEYVLQEVERPLIRSVLELTQGNKGKAAAILGINRNTLRKKIQDLKITLSATS